MKKEPKLIPARLKIARKMAGLSLEDLSRKIGGQVTRQALSKYEQGRMSPSPWVLSKLEEVLDLKPRYDETPFVASRKEIAAEYGDFKNESADFTERANATRRYDENNRPSSDLSNESEYRSNDIICKSSVMPPRSSNRMPDQRNFLRQMDSRSFINADSEPAMPAVQIRPLTPLVSNTISYLEFRRSAPLPKKKEEALKQIALEYLARYEDLERILGNVISFKNPIPDAGARTVEEIEKAAGEVRNRWNLGLAPIGNLLELLEGNGIKVFEIRGMEGTEDFDGLAARSAQGFVIALNMDRPADRIRFTAAHELAHILCRFDGAGEKERLCHVFAGALLLPRAALERELVHRRQKLTLWELGAIKQKYGISLQAIMHRACDLELITPHHLRDFMTAVKYNGWSIDEPVVYRGKEEAVRFKRLLNYAVAERILGMDQAAAFAGTSVSKFKREVGTMI